MSIRARCRLELEQARAAERKVGIKKIREVKEQTGRMDHQWGMGQRRWPWPTARRWGCGGGHSRARPPAGHGRDTLSYIYRN